MLEPAEVKYWTQPNDPEASYWSDEAVVVQGVPPPDAAISTSFVLGLVRVMFEPAMKFIPAWDVLPVPPMSKGMVQVEPSVQVWLFTVVAEFVKSEFGTVPTVTAETFEDSAPTRNTPADDGNIGKL